MADVPEGRPERGEKIIQLTVEEAKQRRWAAGQAKYGPVMYLDPMEEAFDEAIDILNYMDEAKRQGYDSHSCNHIRAFATLVAGLIQEMYQARQPQ